MTRKSFLWILASLTFLGIGWTYAAFYYWTFVVYRYEFMPQGMPDHELGSYYYGNRAGTAVSYEGTPLSPAPDMATFRVVGAEIAADARNVWVAGVLRPDVDAASLQRFPASYYFLDHSRTYFGNLLEPIPEADTATFKSVTRPIYSYPYIDEPYAVDARYVYSSWKRLPDADPDTFRVIDGLYARDNDTIYYLGGRMDIDPKTFEIVDGVFCRDAKSMYRAGHVIAGADPDSFEILDYPYGRDARSVYYENSILSGADPTSFKLYGQDRSPLANYMRDARGVYYRGERIPGADPAMFVPPGR